MTELIDLHLAYMRAAGMAKRTVEDREQVLRRLDRVLPRGLAKAATEELQCWLGQDGWTTKTRETYWTHVVGFFRWTVGGRIQYLDWDPTVDMPRPRPRRRLPRPVTDDQLRLALERLGRPFFRVVLFAAAEGMRASEIADVLRGDVTKDWVHIIGKGDKSRVVPTDPLVWAEVRDEPDGPLIRWRGRRVVGNWLSHETSRHLTRIGLPDVTLHRFRHWFGTTLQRGYRDLQLTADLMGHSSTVTTCGYAQLTDGHRRLGMQTVSAALTATLTPVIEDHQPGCSRLVVAST